MFSIDGLTWDGPCTIEREAEMRPSEISGYLLNKQYFFDALGTYMRFTVTLTPPVTDRARFDGIYEALTTPVGAHTIVMPYNQSAVALVARVESVTDTYVRLPGGGQLWKGVTFTVISNAPTKLKTLSEVLTEGMSATPGVANFENGTTLVKSGGEWEQVEYGSADDTYY